jgi:ABC-type dipeptide/oligopeptide/nickel transport system ATPase subunit
MDRQVRGLQKALGWLAAAVLAVLNHCLERGVGIVVISHDAPLLSRLCSRRITL